MTPKQFQAWMKRHGLSFSATARTLEIARRNVAYYAAGDKPIPRTVALSCWAIDHGAPKDHPATGKGRTPTER